MGDERVTRGADGGLSRVLDRNVAALVARRLQEESAQRLSDRLAEGISRFAGSMAFVLVHAVGVAFWILSNLGLVPGVPRFDEGFVKLAAFTSVEAIFLSTFVLVTQNRMAAAADRRADLDLQISLLAEHELTRLIRLTAALAARHGVEEAHDEELADLQKDVKPEAVMDRMERAERGPGRAASPDPAEDGASVTH